MKKTALGLLAVCLLAGVASDTTRADDRRQDGRAGRSFHRVATVANYLNNGDPVGQTVSEIVAATADGLTLVYTDSPGARVGFIDISNPHKPTPAGTLVMNPDPPNGKEYEPTSVAVLGNRYVLVVADTSESFTEPSGSLLVVDMTTRAFVREFDLGGQPDSIKISPDGRYAAIAIENERDEDIEVDDVEGGLPQAPAGFLVVVEINHTEPIHWVLHTVDLTGLSSYAPDDPEPEFVDINSRNEAVVTLQENNHIVVVNLENRHVTTHFTAGTVTLHDVDATEDGIISLSDTVADVRREPDAIAWIPGTHGTLNVATANEGDLFGGSRGFSIFRTDGSVAFDSGNAFEKLAVQYGHYPEDRSENKGTEPEAIEYARFGPDDYLFVASERGSFVAVYEMDRDGAPSFSQLLPAPFGPEGLLAIPQRNLLIVSGEEDDPSFGVRSTVMIYRLNGGTPAYPQILSGFSEGSPIPWSALSGMVSIPWQTDSLFAVWDSYYTESRIFRIDASAKPAIITDVIAITPQDGTGNYDPEGIAIAPDHTIWIASEGNASDSRPNLLIKADLDGNVLEEIGLPPAIVACRAASTRRGTLGSGFEGVAVLPASASHPHYRLMVAQQRGWDFTTDGCEDLDDDAGGFNGAGEPNRSRLWIYDPQADSWAHIAWELAPKPANASWVGLSEIAELPGGGYMLIERDNRTGDFGGLKTLVKIDAAALLDAAVSGGEKSIFDLRAYLTSNNGWITDKPEGAAVTDEGRVFVVTDNDGVEDWSGETWFLDLGRLRSLFR